MRPSGRQGPVATSFTAFQLYQENEAWSWEHLALTRATVVAGDTHLAETLERFRLELFQSRTDEAAIRHETREMRKRLAEAKPGSTWDPKSGAGRMMDIELLAEAAALITKAPTQDVYEQLRAGVTAGWITDTEHEVLSETYRLTWRLQSAARLLTGERLDPDAIGFDGRAFLLRSTEVDSIEALEADIATACHEAAQVLDAVLARPVPNAV